MENLRKAAALVNEADVVIVVAGNGFAQLEGLDLLDAASFEQRFSAISTKYGVHSVADALALQEVSWAERWTIWSQLIQAYSGNYAPSTTMLQLRQLLADKKYFIATSTFGHFFEQAGFNENRIFNAFGDWTKMQCSSGINHGLKDTSAAVAKVMQAKTPAEVVSLVPSCTVCGQPMSLHMPINAAFYPETDANTRFRWFLTGNEEEKTVFLELGVDETSPQLLEPIIHLVAEYTPWSYVAADLKQSALPTSLAKRSAAVAADSARLIQALSKG